MPVAAFDTHKYAKQLQQAGVPDEQVESQVAALAEAFQSGLQELATKQDVFLVKQDILLLQQDIASVLQELKQESALIRQEMKQLDTRLTGELSLLKWMTGVTFVGVIGILIRLFFRVV